MDMSISKKRPVSQLGVFEKPRVLVMRSDFVPKIWQIETSNYVC